jgi:metal-responsive CopG/Arc/MetJ family transcriptional regulator
MDAKRNRGRPRSVVKLHKRSVSFPPSLYERLEAIALSEERNVNELIVSVLRDFVREREAEKSAGNSEPLDKAA